MQPDDPLGAALSQTRRATRDQVTAVWQAQMDRLHDVLSRDWREQMGRVIDEQFASFETALKPRLLEAQRDVIRSFGRHWNECFQRMQAAETDREWCNSLLDAAGGLARNCAFFSVKGEGIHYQGARGFDPPLHGVPDVIAVQSAPAFLEVVLSGVAAETGRSARDLSPQLANHFGDPAGKALLIPVTAGDRVVGVIYAENALEPSALEAIAMVAGILLGRRMEVAESVRPSSIVKAMMSPDAAAPVAPAATAVGPRPGDPRAERAARVAVSRFLMDNYIAVKAARTGGGRNPIDAELQRMRERFDFPLHYLETHLARVLAPGSPEEARR